MGREQQPSGGDQGDQHPVDGPANRSVDLGFQYGLGGVDLGFQFGLGGVDLGFQFRFDVAEVGFVADWSIRGRARAMAPTMALAGSPEYRRLPSRQRLQSVEREGHAAFLHRYFSLQPTRNATRLSIGRLVPRTSWRTEIVKFLRMAD